MRFEILETVHTPDQEMVLQALEMCSREVSSKVVRYGDRITLQGLGPSSHAPNVRDTTVFCVNAENDTTIISGEVSFQASALLGTQSQGDVVRSKLEELFKQMKAQIGLDGKVVCAASVSPVTTAVGADPVLAPGREPEIRSEVSEAGPADEVSVAESDLAIGLEDAELERVVFPEVEANVEPDRNVWLDELFSQMKAQFALEEGNSAATVADASVAGSDIAEVVPATTDRQTEIRNASSEPGLVDIELSAGLPESTEPEHTVLAEQSVEQRLEAKPHAESDQSFDLKENAWLEELFNQMNAQIDVDESPVAQDVEISIDPARPTSTDGETFVLTEDVCAKEASSAVATDSEPGVMQSTTEPSLLDELLIAEPEVAWPTQPAEGEHNSELVQHAGVESIVELHSNLEPEEGAKPAENFEAQQTAVQEEQTVVQEGTANAVEAGSSQPRIDPGQSVWLQQVIELDKRAKPLHKPGLLLVAAAEAHPRKRLARWGAGLVVLLAVAAGIYSLSRPRPNPEGPIVQSIEQPAAVTTNSLPVTEATHAPDTKQSLPIKQSQVADPAVQVADIKLWLDNWATAMRTRDAGAQAAFYADTVDEYVGKYDVSRDMVLKDREATIHMRKGLWTVKMEKVVIERQTRSEAKVRLVKHFIDEPVPAEIVESFVPTLLTVKRVAKGGWRITSEQDLPPSSAAPATR